LRPAGAWLLAAWLAAGSALAAEAESGGHGANTALWKSLNFAVLAAGIGYLLYKAGRPFLRSRTSEIQRAIAEAARLRQEAEARAAEMDRRLANLAAEIEQLRSEARRQTAQEEERLKADTERLIARLRHSAELEIASAVKRARQELQAHAAQLALELAREKIRRRMTPEIAAGLIDSFVENLGRAARRLH